MKDSTQIITNASGSIEPYKRPTVTLTSFLRKYHNNIVIPEGKKHHNSQSNHRSRNKRFNSTYLHTCTIDIPNSTIQSSRSEEFKCSISLRVKRSYRNLRCLFASAFKRGKIELRDKRQNLNKN